MITVWFACAVEGVDPRTGESISSNRHYVDAASVRQDRRETIFITDDGEIAARWSTSEVDRIVWPEDDDQQPSVGTVEWRQQVLRDHPRAYQPWSEAEDRQLLEELAEGLSRPCPVGWCNSTSRA